MTAAASTALRWLIEVGWQVTLLVALALLAELVLGRVLIPRWRHALHEVLADLQARHRVPIVAQPDVEAELTLSLSDVPLRAALGWIARSAGLRVGLEHGAVVLSESVRPRLEIHEVGDLIAPLDWGDEEDNRNQLQDMIRAHVDPPSWDVDPRYTVCPAEDDLLLVRQSEAAHARIRSMFAAMRRALGREN